MIKGKRRKESIKNKKILITKKDMWETLAIKERKRMQHRTSSIIVCPWRWKRSEGGMKRKTVEPREDRKKRKKTK